MNFNELEKYISADRLATYTTLLGCSDIDKAIGAYYWNKALGGAVYSFLQCLEVSLRNSLHITGKAKFSRETWYEHVCTKAGDNVRKRQIKSGRTPAPTDNEIKITSAVSQLRKQRKVVSASNVIASLMLGFWVNLFKNDYSSANKTLLWPESLPKVFPNAPKAKQLSDFYNELAEINLLRNRFSHHEPLWKSGTVSTVEDAIAFMDDEISKIVDYVRYINVDRANMLLKSPAYKEFKGLNKRDCFDIFIGDTRKILTVQKFKSNINLYLKQVSNNHKIVFVKQRPDSLVRVISY
ncbi:Abi family protein [Geobacter sp.]|uniref:Abi family protein n=1 Tax=Geobacter sp. TaxID=46610 RepID=UPI0027BA37D8|nr:Abi family protein [Geobacter sp.]